MKQITHLKCDACDFGIVKLTVSKVKDTVNALVGDCNSCKKSFGLKSVSRLSVLDAEEVNALWREKQPLT